MKDHEIKTSVLIIGIGHSYRSDDRSGLVIAQRIDAMKMPHVIVIEESGDGASLMEAWQGSEHVILVDAVSSKAKPGTIHRIDAHAQKLSKDFFRYSSHAFSVAEAVEMARALNKLPPHLIIYGIEGESFNTGVSLTPKVEHVLDIVIQQIVSEIVEFLKKDDLCTKHI